MSGSAVTTDGGDPIRPTPTPPPLGQWADHHGVVWFVPRRRERLRLGITTGRAADLALRAFVFVRDDFTCRSCWRRAIDPPADYGGRGTLFVGPRAYSGDDLQLDHIHAWERGGTHHASNLQTLCSSCNSKKGAR